MEMYTFCVRATERIVNIRNVIWANVQIGLAMAMALAVTALNNPNVPEHKIYWPNTEFERIESIYFLLFTLRFWLFNMHLV